MSHSMNAVQPRLDCLLPQLNRMESWLTGHAGVPVATCAKVLGTCLPDRSPKRDFLNGCWAREGAVKIIGPGWSLVPSLNATQHFPSADPHPWHSRSFDSADPWEQSELLRSASCYLYSPFSPLEHLKAPIFCQILFSTFFFDQRQAAVAAFFSNHFS